MSQSCTAFIVSVFGRGHWLAAQLQRMGIATTLIDLSSQMGIWPSEISEGPFGLFRSDILDESMLACLNAGDLWNELPEGFNIWMAKGPLSFKGALTRFQLEKMGYSQDLIESILSGRPSKVLNGQDFKKQWLPSFLSQLSSTYFVEPPLALLKNPSHSAVGSAFSVRWVTRQGLEKSYQWLRENGVTVLSDSEVVDLVLHGKNSVTGAELRGEMQGVYRFDQLIWCLSSEETFFVNEKIGRHLFGEVRESTWCWLRYRVQVGECFEREVLPLTSVLLNDELAPWTHENLMFMQRTALPDQFDIWLRLPTVQRFNKDYLTQRGHEVVESLKLRLEQAEIKVLTYPQEYYYTYAQLGAPRFPLFDHHMGAGTLYQNIFYHSPESWRHFGVEYTFAEQKNISDSILKWWNQKILAEQKKKANQ